MHLTNKFALGAIALGLVTSSSTAHAQEAVIARIVNENSFDAEAVNTLEGTGFTLADGAQLHLSIGVRGGASDNVFFESSDEDPTRSGIMGLVGTMYITNDVATAEDMGELGGEITPRSVHFRGGLRGRYNEFLSGNDDVQAQRNLNLDALADVVVLPGGPDSFLASDRLIRDQRSPNLEDSSTIRRLDNRLRLGLQFHPESSTISGTIAYENWVNMFENDGPSQFSDRMNQTIRAQLAWQWRPMTAFTADVSYGFFGPIGDGQFMGMPFKTDSQPFSARVGMATLLSELTTLKVHGGYTRASYEVGQGYSAPVAGIELGYRWATTGRVLLQYDYDHFDSVNANFYRDHTFALRAVQLLGNVVLDGGPEVRLRHFGGIPMVLGAPERDDIVLRARARAQLLFAEKFSVSAEYLLGIVDTTYRANNLQGGTDNPSFVRNELFLGVRATY